MIPLSLEISPFSLVVFHFLKYILFGINIATSAVLCLVFHSISFSILFLSFWPCRVTCRMLVPRPGIEPMPPAVEAQSPNHWTAREFPLSFYFLLLLLFIFKNLFHLFIFGCAGSLLLHVGFL